MEEDDEMKVALVNPYPYSLRNSGGIESVLYSLDLELQKRGIETELISLSEKELQIIPKFDRISILAIILNKLLHRKDKFDIIHAHSWATPLLRFIGDKPKVATSHGTTIEFLKRVGNTLPLHSRIYNRMITVNLERIGFDAAKILTTVSYSSMREIMDNYHISKEKIRVIYNGINPNETYTVRTDLKRLTNIRSKYQCKYLLLFIGRIARSKGIEVLINALPILEDYDYKLIIAGTGRDEMAMRRHILSLGLANRVEFTGSLEGSRKLEFLSASDVFVFPSLSESFGLSLLDAMACKVPIVASDVASIPEVVGDCGILVKPANPYALANGIRKLLDDKKYAQRLTSKAYERLISKFTVKKMVDEYIEIYNEVCST